MHKTARRGHSTLGVEAASGGTKHCVGSQSKEWSRCSSALGLTSLPCGADCPTFGASTSLTSILTRSCEASRRDPCLSFHTRIRKADLSTRENPAVPEKRCNMTSPMLVSKLAQRYAIDVFAIRVREACGQTEYVSHTVGCKCCTD